MEALGAKRKRLAGISAEVPQVIWCGACAQPSLVGEGALGLVVSHRKVDPVERDEQAARAGKVRVVGVAGSNTIRVSHAHTPQRVFGVSCNRGALRS